MSFEFNKKIVVDVAAFVAVQKNFKKFITVLLPSPHYMPILRNTIYRKM